VSPPSPWLLLGLGVATFLAAAKAHGRQLRLERELAGYWEVSFRARNPAFVETLWRRERIAFWSLVALLAASSLAWRLLAPRPGWSVAGALLLHILAPLTAAFVVTGLLSTRRFLRARRAGAVTASLPPDWSSRAARGTAGWWALTLAMCAGLSWLAVCTAP